MGREVRHVPANWQHPKEQVYDSVTDVMVETFRPLYPYEEYMSDVNEWDDECAKWKTGWRPDEANSEVQAMEYEQYAGQRPHRDDYMPNWPTEERTHLMMYENVTEGTPISPACATAEELVRWLKENGASRFAHARHRIRYG